MDTMQVARSIYEVREKHAMLSLLLKPGEKRLLAKKSLFLCECGVIKEIRVAHVVNGITASCGCIKRKHKVAVGHVSGRLVVIDAHPVTMENRLKVLCRCECGTEKYVGLPEVCLGLTKSCGCLVVEVASKLSRTHGDEGSRLYSVWHSMKARCSNRSAENYPRYGGRGISVCREWMDSYPAFKEWAVANGYSEELQIDRREVDGNYEPDNCRFVTPMVNANNRGNNVWLEAFGERMTMRDWSRDPRCAVSYSSLKNRIRRCKFPSHEEAITRPARSYG